MKGKYITTQILLACGVRPAETKKNIYQQLEETIAERKIILATYYASLSKSSISTKDVHALLKETLAERRRIMENLNYTLINKPFIYNMNVTQAA